MIPFEALLPYAIMLTLLSISGGGMEAVHYFRNEKKRDRYNVDSFDKKLMMRDYRLTGSMRGQSDAPVAPEAFRYSSMWQFTKKNPT